MSSGFIASNARKYAKKNKVDISVEARSHAEVNEYMNSIDILLLGPHYAGELENFRNKAAAYNVKVDVIPEKMYASLDGQGIVELATKLAENS